MSTGMTERLGAQKSIFINFINANNKDGIKSYYYVAVKGDDMLPFHRALRRGHFDLSDFGVVIASGVGEPTEEVKETIEKIYGCNHEQAAMLSLK